MNNEKILNIMENLAKAVYDIGATVKHIYKDEHPSGPAMPTPPKMPMPTMPGQPNQFQPPRPQPWPAPSPHPMVTKQDIDFSNYVFQQVFHPNDNSSLKSSLVPKPKGPNEFCNMQDYTFQRMNGNVPAKAKILSDPFMKPNQTIESDPDKLFNNIDLGGGNPEPIRNLVKENPDAVKKAVKNLGMMKTLGSPCWDIARSDELEKEIDSIRVAINVAVQNCDTAALKEKSDRLIGLSLARSYLQFGESDRRKKLLQEEMKDNPSALQIFNDAVSRAEAEQDKELKESLRQYNKYRVVTDNCMGVGDSLKESMDNWGKQKPVERNVPINPPVDAMSLNQRPSEADMEKNYLSSIDAKETVGKMSAVLDECSRLTNEPAIPGNPVLDEEMDKEVEEFHKGDLPETPVVPDPDELKTKVKKEIKKKLNKEIKQESESPEKAEENAQVTSASAW
ncbi:MAG: hypothetical protein IKN15_02545 [Bacteroidaceae bacterium]|nr:hypothetical protein [Bacteroidaceae bacterium]